MPATGEQLVRPPCGRDNYGPVWPHPDGFAVHLPAFRLNLNLTPGLEDSLGISVLPPPNKSGFLY